MSELTDKLCGVFRQHLFSESEHFDIYLESCRFADKDKHPDAFCITGGRYLVVDTRDGEEYPASFPKEVESIIAELEKKEEVVEDCESQIIYSCPDCGATDDVDDLEEDEVGLGYICNNCGHEGMEEADL